MIYFNCTQPQHVVTIHDILQKCYSVVFSKIAIEWLDSIMKKENIEELTINRNV